jgi:hypothetical protein
MILKSSLTFFPDDPNFNSLKSSMMGVNRKSLTICFGYFMMSGELSYLLRPGLSKVILPNRLTTLDVLFSY